MSRITLQTRHATHYSKLQKCITFKKHTRTTLKVHACMHGDAQMVLLGQFDSIIQCISPLYLDILRCMKDTQDFITQ